MHFSKHNHNAINTSLTLFTDSVTSLANIINTKGKQQLAHRILNRNLYFNADVRRVNFLLFQKECFHCLFTKVFVYMAIFIHILELLCCIHFLQKDFVLNTETNSGDQQFDACSRSLDQQRGFPLARQNDARSVNGSRWQTGRLYIEFSRRLALLSRRSRRSIWVSTNRLSCRPRTPVSGMHIGRPQVGQQMDLLRPPHVYASRHGRQKLWPQTRILGRTLNPSLHSRQVRNSSVTGSG